MVPLKVKKLALATVAVAVAMALATQAAENPPPDDSRLQFKKTLHIQNTPKGERIFAESRTISRGEFIENILRDDYGIAKEDLPFFMAAFRELNPDTDPKKLVAGKAVKIPFKVELSAAAPPPEKASPAAVEPPKAQPAAARLQNKYTVKKGDTLWSILSKIYGVDKMAVKSAISHVQKSNPKLKDINTLFVGQVLDIPVDKIPADEAQAPKAIASPTPTPQVPQIIAAPSPNKPEPAPTAEPPKPQTVEPVASVASKTAPPPVEAIATAPKPAPEKAAETSASPPAKEERAVEIFALLEKLGCKIEKSGERYIPISRGRSIKLDASVFPLVSGPAGGKILIDEKGQLAGEISEAIKNVWGYKAIRPEGKSAETFLGEVLSELKFHELREGAGSIALPGKFSLKTRAKWTVTPLPEDKWRGGTHLLFPAETTFDPDLLSLALENGYAVDMLGEAKELSPTKTPVAVSAKLPDSSTIEGAAQILSLLGIKSSIKPALTLKLDSGTSYTIRPQLVFESGSLKYGVPPQKPANAESIMVKAGYFTFPWPGSTDPVARVADLLALMGVSANKKELSLPQEGAFSLSVFGVVIDSPALTASLYPELSESERAERKVFLTAASLPPKGVSLLYRNGFLPWAAQ